MDCLAPYMPVRKHFSHTICNTKQSNCNDAHYTGLTLNLTPGFDSDFGKC
jgi:hypothetical protein